MKKWYSIVGGIFYVLILSQTLCAQGIELAEVIEKNTHYTYKTDRLFYTDKDLLGYTFYPDQYQHNNESKLRAAAGEVSISFTPTMVFFSGISALQKFSIISFNQTNDGYNLDLMDSRNPTFRGTMEIYVNKNKQCEGLLFFAKSSGQYAFFLPEKSDFQLNKDAAYFTIQEVYKISRYEDMIGTRVTPFMWVRDQVASKEMEKINAEDSISIEFKSNQIIVHEGDDYANYDFKKTEIYTDNSGDANVRVSKMIEITWAVNKKFKINIHITPSNLVHKIEVGPSVYYLMMSGM